MLEKIKSKRLTFSELFSISKDIYKQNIKTILFVSFVIIIPLYLFNQWILSKAVINLDYLYNNMVNIDMTTEMNAITSSSIYDLASSAAQLVLQPLANIAIIYGAINIIKNKKSSFQNNFLYSFLKAPAAIWTNFLETIILVIIMLFFMTLAFSFLMFQTIGMLLIFIVILACVAAVAYCSTIWTFADSVVVIQNLSGMKALITSKRTVKGYFWETFIYTILFGVLSSAIGVIINKVLYSASDTVYYMCYGVWNFVNYVVINGFYIVFITVLFLNRVWLTTSDYRNMMQQQDMEKMFNQSDENNSDLEKMTEQNQQQQNEKEDK